MRIQVPGFACNPRSLPAGRYGAAMFGNEVAYFLTAAMRLHPSAEPDVRVVILNAIADPQIPPFSVFAVHMLGQRSTLLYDAEAFIKVDPKGITPANHAWHHGAITVYEDQAFLATSQGAVNLTNGDFDTDRAAGTYTAFTRWSLCLPDGDKVTELFTFGQP